MAETVPRLASVIVERDNTVALSWRDGRTTSVDLAGWIASGGDVLEPLTNPRIFARAALSMYGAGVTWDDDEGDLGIDAAHLDLLAANTDARVKAEA